MNTRTYTGALLVFILISTLCVDASAQAWIRAPGEGFVDVSYTVLSGDKFYNADGDSQPLASTFTQTSVGLYGELGLVERWLQLTVSGEVLRTNELEDQGSTQGLGDFRLGVWSGLLQGGPVNVSVGLIAGLPTGDATPDAEGEDAEAQGIARSLPTGDGEYDLEPNITAGTSFGGDAWPLRHYLVGSFGYQLRTEGISDALTYRLELGSQVPWSVLERVWFIGRVTGLESLNNGGEANSFAGFGDGVTFTGISADVAVSVWEGLGISVGAGTAVRAKNIISGRPVKASLNYTF